MKNKLRVVALIAGIICASQVNAEIYSHAEKDGSLTITRLMPSSHDSKSQTTEYKIDKNSSFLKNPTIYDLKVYRVEANDSAITTTGVYSNGSPLLKVDGKFITKASVVGTPIANISINNNVAYVKSVTTDVKDQWRSTSKILAGNVKSGFNLTIFETGKNVYNIDLSQVNLDSLLNFKTGDDTIQLPRTTEWSTSNTMYIPKDKTARLNSMKYTIDGKDYQNVYLISAKSE